MGTYDVRIIPASYRREPKDGPESAQRPVIQLFGRTREGKSIAVEYSGFKPYFFAVNPPASLGAALAKDAGVERLEDHTLEVDGKPMPCAKVVLHHPWRTPEDRERVRS